MYYLFDALGLLLCFEFGIFFYIAIAHLLPTNFLRLFVLYHVDSSRFYSIIQSDILERKKASIL